MIFSSYTNSENQRIWIRTYHNNTIQPKSNLIEHDSFEELMLNK
jgi:hypothetical protein